MEIIMIHDNGTDIFQFLGFEENMEKNVSVVEYYIYIILFFNYLNFKCVFY